MANAVQKIVLSISRDIPFNRLVLSQSNVRRIKADVSIEELAEDIARRTLLQSLGVRPVVDEEGKETGMFEVPAGGRRYRALELLVKQKRMAKTQPVPCVVRTEGLAEEDSLVENMQREALHPLDQFRSFQTLREKGLSEEEIAARFFVSATVVKQRLKLAAVSPKLHALYADDQITLDQLMAFTVTSDHARQEQVWDALASSYFKEPHIIRRQLTERAVQAADRRALFVGLDAYQAAGGAVMRDLFTEDRGGWLQDPALLDRLVEEKLKTEAQAIASDGWKWISVAAEFPYGHTAGLQRLVGEPIGLNDEEIAASNALQAEYEALEVRYEGSDELPEEADERLGELEAALGEFENSPFRYDPAQMAHAGVFISLDGEGALRIERGYIRPEDATAMVRIADGDAEGEGASERPNGDVTGTAVQRAIVTIGGEAGDAARDAAEEDEGLRPLSDRLVTELTAHRTLALRDCLGGDFDTAFIAVLHSLALTAFYMAPWESCLELTLKQTGFAAQAPGLSDADSAKAIEARHESWRKHLPGNAAELWAELLAFDPDSRRALFAHCASLGVNAVHEPWNRNKARQHHADKLAAAVKLDVAAAGWRPTVDNYLGRVSKARIIEAVREAKGDKSAELIDHLKKADMAREAERLLEGAGWLPEPLRVADADEMAGEQAATGEAEALPEFLADEEQDDEDASRPQAAPLRAAE
jgi:ParB family chromosome partitioning protein